MNRRMIINAVGLVLRVEAALLLLPAVVGVIYGERQTWLAFLLSAAISLVLGMLPKLFIKPRTHVIYAKEGFIIVAFTWIMLSLVGALPLVLSGALASYVDAFFEIVSGFTTTGASVIPDVEVLSHGVLFWRSFTHWVGGMGIIVFVMAILPNVSERPIHILRAEMPGPTVGKLVPRIKDTALILYIIYIAMTLIETVMLLFGGMSFFASLLHAFGTAGTGGFGIKRDSIAGYSPYIQWVITAFMILFGINFNLYYLMLLKKFKAAFSSSELWYFFGIVLSATALIAWNIRHLFGGIEETVRTAAFQVASVISTTGYATADFNLWPNLSKNILFILMFIGGCAGSTAGGIKVSRIVLLFKLISNEVKRMLHPRSVSSLRFEGKTVDGHTRKGVSNYFLIYFVCLLAIFLALSFEPFDFETNFTAAVTCFNNVGPGFGAVGPTGGFGDYSAFAKVVLSFAMLLGRLEIFPIIIALAPVSWARNK